MQAWAASNGTGVEIQRGNGLKPSLWSQGASPVAFLFPQALRLDLAGSKSK